MEVLKFLLHILRFSRKGDVWSALKAIKIQVFNRQSRNFRLRGSATRSRVEFFRVSCELSPKYSRSERQVRVFKTPHDDSRNSLPLVGIIFSSSPEKSKVLFLIPNFNRKSFHYLTKFEKQKLNNGNLVESWNMTKGVKNSIFIC